MRGAPLYLYVCSHSLLCGVLLQPSMLLLIPSVLNPNPNDTIEHLMGQNFHAVLNMIIILRSFASLLELIHEGL